MMGGKSKRKRAPGRTGVGWCRAGYRTLRIVSQVSQKGYSECSLSLSLLRGKHTGERKGCVRVRLVGISRSGKCKSGTSAVPEGVLAAQTWAFVDREK